MFKFEFNVIKRWTITWLLLSREFRLLWRTHQLREDQIKVSLTLILFRFNEWTETFFYGVIKKLLYHPVVTACLLSYLVKESERPYKFLWETFKIIRLNKMFNICDICTHHFKHTHTQTPLKSLSPNRQTVFWSNPSLLWAHYEHLTIFSSVVAYRWYLFFHPWQRRNKF